MHRAYRPRAAQSQEERASAGAARAAGFAAMLGTAVIAGPLPLQASPEPAFAPELNSLGGDPWLAAASSLAALGGPSDLGQGPVLAQLGATATKAPKTTPPAPNLPLPSPPLSILDAPVVSGLPWRSGMSCGDAAHEAWRGRKLDVLVTFVDHDTWPMMIQKLQGSYVRNGIKLTPQPVVSLAMMPRSAKKQHAACAQGQFDSYFKQFGTLLVKAGGGRAIVRLGWEANESTSHSWAISTAAEIPNYIACFRREVAALKSTAPDIKIEWTNSKRGKMTVSMLDSYPGDDVVDIWGLNTYNFNPVVKTQADWDTASMALGKYGAPLGIGQWLRAAAARGKQIAISEWGVWDRDGLGPSGTDQPVYIANMFKFFAANAPYIAYENYYNCPKSTHIGPVSRFPKASAMYRQSWSADLQLPAATTP